MSLAAAELGVPGVVLMPRDAPAIKIDGARRNGAEVVLYDREHDDREVICAQLMRARVMFFHSFLVGGMGLRSAHTTSSDRGRNYEQV